MKPRPDVEAKAERMVENLRKYWHAGKEYNNLPDGYTERRAQLEKLMKENALSESTLRKAAAFQAQYSEKELEKLCRLKRPNGLPLHTGYIPYLLTANPGDRKFFLQQVLQNNWSAPQLHRAIRGKPKEKPGGRQLVIPQDPKTALEQVVAEGRLWARRCQHVLEKRAVDKTGPDFRSRLEDLLSEVQELSRTARTLERALKGLAGKR